MNLFQIGETEFGIGKSKFTIDNNLLNLEINGNDQNFNDIMEDDSSEWSWTLYPPKFYLKDVPFDKKKIIIDNDYLNKYDIALYMMEYCDFIGTLEITDGFVYITGHVNIMGKSFPLTINYQIPSNIK